MAIEVEAEIVDTYRREGFGPATVLPSGAEFTEQDLMRSQLLTKTIEAIELLSELVTKAGEGNFRLPPVDRHEATGLSAV